MFYLRRGGVFLCFLFLSAFLVCGFSRAAKAQGVYEDDIRRAQAAMTPADWRNWRQLFAAAQAANPDFRVESVEEFVKINAWYRAFVDDGVIRHAFTTERGDQIFCIDVRTQRALLAAGDDPNRLPQPPLIARPLALPAAGERPRPTGSAGLDGSLDDLGRVRRCPAGSFPKLIPPLEKYYRFRTLADIFKKLPNSDERPFPASRDIRSTGGYDWSEASGDYVENYGLEADFNLWQNYAQFPIEHSLAEIWNLGHYGELDMQTAEAGILHTIYVNGNDDMCLFIYFTADNYQYTGCYNLDCAGFVQTDWSVVIGGPFANYSEFGGDQYYVKIGFIRSGDGNWWLYIDGVQIGYYPVSLYEGGAMSEHGDVLMYGGEVYQYPTAFVTLEDMGSGRFSTAGWQYAAFVQNMQYYDLSSTAQDAYGLIPYASNPTYWDIGAVHYSDDPNLEGVSLYYGGPGNTACNATSCASGCCDGDANCQDGTDENACGAHGAACVQCAEGDVCMDGVCESSDDDDTTPDDDTISDDDTSADDDSDDDSAQDDDAVDDDSGDDDASPSTNDDDDSGSNGCGC